MRRWFVAKKKPAAKKETLTETCPMCGGVGKLAFEKLEHRAVPQPLSDFRKTVTLPQPVNWVSEKKPAAKKETLTGRI
jgi:hypothetical protein